MTATHQDAGQRRAPRVAVGGPVLRLDGDRLYVRGVTYGTFRADASGDEYPPPAVVSRDLSMMAANGINAVRTYTLPPRWLLDLAAEQGVLVLAGLAAERSVGYLNDGRRAEARAVAELARAVARSAGHPALLGYCVGNEIPGQTVRWLGPRRVERFLDRVCDRVRDADPSALVSYANYPTTEYLELPFLDFVCFNVFLEERDKLAAYLARLQNLSGDRPLLMTELGLDSARNGEHTQAESVRWQLQACYEAGCAGAFVYAWTDEWHRGGEDVHDWAFGLTDRERLAKPALAAAREVFAGVPFPHPPDSPRVSVVVCAYNAGSTIDECLAAATRLDYPDYEVVVVDDGSTDGTGALVERYPVRVVRTENRGLSSARNTGLAAAGGEIVAYLDSDAYPDPHWLRYLVQVFRAHDVVGVGGPNLPPPGDGAVAECVAAAPGGPTHVLLTDVVAEHIPGCNMAFRASSLREVGGFDARFRAAGDDVDLCWRLQERGGVLGFCPAALVWHHRRGSVVAYWRQQRGYGRAEAMLEDKWPERYNTAGHVRWLGRIYDRSVPRRLVGRPRIYHGTWGSAPFQSLYRPVPGSLASLPLTPEWLLLALTLVCGCLVAAPWAPLALLLPLSAAAVLTALPVVLLACVAAARAPFAAAPRSPTARLGRRALTAFLHLLQPAARLRGRLSGGLTLWRGHRVRGFRLPLPRSGWTWSAGWVDPQTRLGAIEAQLAAAGSRARRNGGFDRWDLELKDGPLGSARLLLSVEDLGGGAQLVRFRCWPLVRRTSVLVLLAFLALTATALLSAAPLAAVVFTALGAAVVGLCVLECGAALGALLAAVRTDHPERGRPA